MGTVDEAFTFPGVPFPPSLTESPLSFRRVAQLSDVPHGRGRRVVVDGLEIGLFRVDGRIHAMENACPHAGDPLSEGELTGCVVVCPAHGWDFDVRTGFKPGDADGFPIPCFAVSVRGDEIWVDVDQVINRPPRRGGSGEGAPR